MLTLCRWVLGLFWYCQNKFHQPVTDFLSFLHLQDTVAGHWCPSTGDSSQSLLNVCIVAVTSLCLRYLARSAFNLFFCIHPLPPSSCAEDGEATWDDHRARTGFLSVNRLAVSHVHPLYFPSPACQNPAWTQLRSWTRVGSVHNVEFTMLFPCRYHRVDTKETGAMQGQSFEVWLQEV